MARFSPSNTSIPDLDVDDGTLSIDETNNRVGIGTTTPGALLHTVDGAVKFEHSTSNLEVDFESNDSAIIKFVNNGAGESTIFRTNRYFKFDTGDTSNALIINAAGNVGIGATTFDGTAAGNLVIKNGTSPAALTADQIYIGSKDSAGSGTDTKATLEIFTEEAVDATALASVGTLTTRLPIWVNGTCYWLYLDPV